MKTKGKTTINAEPVVKEVQESEARVAIPIPLVSLPDLSVWDSEEAEKIEAMASLIGLKATTSAKRMYEAAKIALNAAETFKRLITEYNAGLYKVDVKTPPSVVKMPWHDRLATDVKLGRTIAIRGPAGNGKSLGARTTLEAMGFKVYSMDCTDSTTAEMLVGGLYPTTDSNGMTMEFREGLFAKAFQDPKGAILLDEFDALDPRIGMVLQSALHRAVQGKKRILSCPDHPKGILEAIGDCPVVVTMNTWGSGATREYVGRNAIDAASMDRFDTVIDTNYADETSILISAGYSYETATKVVNLAMKLRCNIDSKNLRIVLSTRRLLNVAETMDKLSIGLDKAFSRDFYERLEPIDREALGVKL